LVSERRPLRIVGRAHSNVNVFKNLLAGNAAATVGGFDNVVTDVALMLAAKTVYEEKGFGEATGSNQEPSAIHIPICRIVFHDALSSSSGEGEDEFSVASFRKRFQCRCLTASSQ